VALQQSTREIWAATGPFEQYPISRRLQRNVPSAFLKEAVWQVINGVEHYYTKSHAPEESGSTNWYPVEFNFEQVCWVEVHWVEPVAGEGYWQAFRIAGEDLHLDTSAIGHLSFPSFHGYCSFSRFSRFLETGKPDTWNP
jgi:hypothetical protein